jgi:hypothetical protein
MTLFLHPTEQAGAALFARNITGAVVMLNMLRFRDIADYSTCAGLKPPHRYQVGTRSKDTSITRCRF